MDEILIEPLHLKRWPTAKTFPQRAQYKNIPKDTGEGQGSVFIKNSWAKREELVFEETNKAEYTVMNMKLYLGAESA